MSSKGKTVLVTGGAGYIGSHTALLLKAAGYDVVILDNLVYGHQQLVESVIGEKIVVGDICDRSLLLDVFKQFDIKAVMHFAAYAYVGESVSHPSKYYRNNVAGTLTLIEAMVEASVRNIVFSSTCATYGVPDSVPITETHPQRPINPYGVSKHIVERMLFDFSRAYDLSSVIFRYFNAAGAHPDGLLGEDHLPETHLIPLVMQTALGMRDRISIFGSDYSTHDGTCIRDYIHVMDLARAHILGLEHLLAGKKNDVFNLSNGDGFSVNEIVQAARKVSDRDISVEYCDRRLGDPPALVGCSDKARQLLGWTPAYADIEVILSHAWQWHQVRHQVQHPLDSAVLTAAA